VLGCGTDVGPAGVLPGAVRAAARTDEPADETVSRACFALLGAVDGGRFRTYRDSTAPDEDGCAAAFWRQVEGCRYAPGSYRRIALRVPGAGEEGDFVVSAALCVWAARDLLAAPSGPAAGMGHGAPGR
jgi:hypothetical protein